MAYMLTPMRPEPPSDPNHSAADAALDKAERHLESLLSTKDSF